MTPADQVVINVPRRTDRLLRFQATWGTDVRVVPAVTEPDAMWGCLRSHLGIWEQVTVDTLILEDDAVPLLPLELPAQLPDDWDLIMLGGQHASAPRFIGYPGLLASTGTLRTHAYVLRGDRAARTLAVIAAQTEQPSISQRLLHATRAGLLAVYTVTPWQVGQAAGRSDITGQDHPLWTGA